MLCHLIRSDPIESETRLEKRASLYLTKRVFTCLYIYMSSLNLWMEEWHKQEDVYRVGNTANPPNVLDIVKLYFSLNMMKLTTIEELYRVSCTVKQERHLTLCTPISTYSVQ